jgi:dienelactone hydrolase
MIVSIDCSYKTFINALHDLDCNDALIGSHTFLDFPSCFIYISTIFRLFLEDITMALIISHPKARINPFILSVSPIYEALSLNQRFGFHQTPNDLHLHLQEYKVLGAFYVQKEKHARLMDAHGILRRDEINADLTAYLSGSHPQPLNNPFALTHDHSCYVIYNQKEHRIELYDLASKTLLKTFNLVLKSNESIHMIDLLGRQINPNFLLFEIVTHPDAPEDVTRNAFWSWNLTTGDCQKVTSYFDNQNEQILKEKGEKIAKLEEQIRALEAQDPESKTEESKAIEDEITKLKKEMREIYPNHHYKEAFHHYKEAFLELDSVLRNTHTHDQRTQKIVSLFIQRIRDRISFIETLLEKQSAAEDLNHHQLKLSLSHDCELVQTIKRTLLEHIESVPLNICLHLEELDSLTDAISHFQAGILAALADATSQLKNLHTKGMTPGALNLRNLKNKLQEFREQFGTKRQEPFFTLAIYPNTMNRLSDEVVFFHYVHLLDEALKNKKEDGHIYICSYNLCTGQTTILNTLTELITDLVLDENGNISTLICQSPDAYIAKQLDEKGHPEVKFIMTATEKRNLSAKLYKAGHLILFDGRFTDKRVPILKSLKDNSERHLLSYEEEQSLKSDVIDVTMDQKTDQVKAYLTCYDQEEMHIRSANGQFLPYPLRSAFKKSTSQKFLERFYANVDITDPLVFKVRKPQNETRYLILTKPQQSQKPQIDPIFTQAHPLPISPVTKGKLSKKTKAFTFKARDGLNIQAYITFPQHTHQYHDLPTVLVVHGGPNYRDQFNLNEEALFWSSRGFAVVRINFRGSKGFGSSFLKSSWGDWHGKMTDDLIDGLDFLKLKNIIAPHRIVAIGHSYGAFATASLLTKYPDYFQCGIAQNGTYDLIDDFQATVDQTTIHNVGFEARQFGANPMIPEQSDEAKEKLKSQSPATFIPNMTKPLLLITGSADDNCLPSQASNFAREAKKWGKSVTHVEFEGEGHVFSLRNLPHIMGVQENFVAQYVPGIYAEPMEREMKQNPAIKVKTTSRY